MKFRIKIPNTELYVQEKRNASDKDVRERVWKDGSHSDEGIVWEFDKYTTNVRNKKIIVLTD